MESIIGFIAGMLLPIILGYVVVKFKPEFVFRKLVDYLTAKYDENVLNSVTNHIGFWMIDAGLWLLRKLTDNEDVEFTVIKLMALKEQLRAQLNIPQE